MPAKGRSWALPWNAWVKLPVPFRAVAAPLQISALLLLCVILCWESKQGPRSRSWVKQPHTHWSLLRIPMYIDFPGNFLFCKGIWLSNQSSAWSHAGQGFAFTSQSLLGATCLIKQEFQQGGKWEEKIPRSLCGFIFNRDFLGWALPFKFH